MQVKVVETVGTASINGSGTPVAQESTTYTASVTGNNVDDLTYRWSVNDADANIVGGNTASANITFAKAGNATIALTVGSDSIADADSTTKPVNVSTAKTIGTVTVTGDTTTPTATQAENFQSEYSGNIVDATYQWATSPSANVQIQSPTTKDTNITFNAVGTYHVTCKVTSATANDSPQTSPEFDVTVAGLPDMPAVSLGGSQTVNTLNVGKDYTSNTQDGSTLAGTTTYQWTAEDEDGNKTSNGAVFSTVAGKSATDQNCQIVFTQDNKTYKIRCKWTNNAYADSPKTGMRTVTVDTTQSETE